MRGRFITFEGGEGAGKSTQVERLRRRVEALGHPVIVTREPGGSPRAERIREAILSGRAKAFGPAAEALLFYAARADHLETLIRPALEKGINVLCDRFADSTRAYQGALGQVPPGILSSLDRVVVGETEPDLTIVLDVPAEVGLARARRRRDEKGEGADRFESERRSFHEALRQAFRDIARARPERCVLVDASADPDTVEEAIWTAVRERAQALTIPATASADVA
ncbi:MAG TPA: dTMP kinase [Microvirga sp.]|nr:dTMP kinase [Microvirga sp.]